MLHITYNYALQTLCGAPHNVCNDSGKIDKLPPNRLYGHTDFLAGTFFVCGSRRGDFVSLTDKQLARYEKIYHFPIVFLPTPHGLLALSLIHI